MYRTEFPKIEHLKARIADHVREGSGWPTCILHVRTKTEDRPKVRGPLSIFLNLKGKSHCKAGSHEVVVGTNDFFLTNRGQVYDLNIDGDEEVETFNIHIEERLTEEVIAGHYLSEGSLLDIPDRSGPPVEFFTQLYRRDEGLDRIVRKIRNAKMEEIFDPLKESEMMCELTSYLLGRHQKVLRDLGQMPALRKGTREEIYRRLSVARDYMHSYFDRPLPLDRLAQMACMSRYHFLRRFRDVFGHTPHQYLMRIRLGKARTMLAETEVPISDIAFRLGYQDLSSFSRAFRKSFKEGPRAFRENNRRRQFAILVKS